MTTAARGVLDELLAPGHTIGRYRIDRLLGGGGMGVVYAAQDLELDRVVAIKVVRPDRASAEGRERLAREARALARISHPNVVTVHDIGTIDDQVYIAMELVAGVTLRRWLETGERPWNEIVARFAEAGRGLAAVHDAGLVHRDFKPDNVLLGHDGTARVADFGLAGILDDAESPVSRTGPVGIPDRLTQTGAVMGTARYMAPEQHRGEPATAATDQFAFCVSLYEALYRRHPFAAKTYIELRDNVEQGRFTPPSGGGATPARIADALATGMMPACDQRHPSMAVLLDLLLTDPTARRRQRLRVAGAMVGFGVVVAALAWGLIGRDTRCVSDHALDGVWDGNVKRRVGAVFAVANQADGARRFEAAVDVYARSWATMRTDACEATHLRAEQSEVLLDRRMLCLDQRKHYLARLVSNIGPDTTADGLASAVRAALELPSLERCANTEQLLEVSPLPESGPERANIAALEAAIDDGEALKNLGSLESAAAALETALKRGVDHAPTLARGYLLLGKTTLELGRLDDSAKQLQRSVELGTRAGDDSLVAEAWISLMYLEGVEKENHARAYELGELARLALLRGQATELEFAELDRSTAGVLVREGKTKQAAELIAHALPVYEKHASGLQLADVFHTLGEIHETDKKLPEATADYEQALSHIEQALGSSHPEYANTLNNLAVVLKNKGDLAGARKALERCLAITERSLGKTHRRMVGYLGNLGNVQQRQGKGPEAIATFQRAIDIGTVALGPRHPYIASAMLNMAIVYSEAKDHERATALLRDVLARQIEALGPDHPRVANALNNLGESLFLQQKYAESLDVLLRAKATKERISGADHPSLADTLALLGAVYARLGKPEQAAASYHRALDVHAAVAKDGEPLMTTILSELGHLYETTGAPDEAVPYLERAVTARVAARGTGAITGDEASDRFALIRALWRGKQRVRAAELAAALGEDLRGSSAAEPAAVATELDRWLQRH